MKKVVSLLLVSITLLSFISCNDNSTDKYTNNGGKDYINISEKNRLVSENSIVIEGIDAVHAVSTDGSSFFASGISRPSLDNISFNILNSENGEKNSYIPNFEYNHITEFIIINNMCSIIYNDKNFDKYIAVTDFNGNIIKSLNLTKDDTIISLTNVGDNIGVFTRNTSDEEALNVYDTGLNLISHTDISDKTDPNKKRIILSAYCNYEKNIIIQTILKSDNEENPEPKILNLSPQGNLIYQIDDFSDMPGFFPALLTNSEQKNVIAYSVEKKDDNNNIVYINSYNPENGETDKRYELETEYISGIYTGTDDKNIVCLQSDKLCRYNLETKEKNTIYDSNSSDSFFKVFNKSSKYIVTEQSKLSAENLIINEYDTDLKLKNNYSAECSNVSEILKFISTEKQFCFLASTTQNESGLTGYNNEIFFFDKETAKLTFFDFTTQKDFKSDQTIILQDIEYDGENIIALVTIGYPEIGGSQQLWYISKSDFSVVKKKTLIEDHSNYCHELRLYDSISVINDTKNIFLYGEFKKEKYIYDLSNDKETILGNTSIINKTNMSFYNKSIISLLTIDTESGQYEEIMPDFEIEDIVSISPDRFLCAENNITNHNSNLTVFRNSKSENEKNISICGINIYNDALRNAVASYNKSHENNYITLVQLDNESQMQNVLIQNQCDIIISNNSFNIGNYTSMEIAEDLVPYIENDKETRYEDFLDNVFELQKDNDKLYSLCPEFKLDTMIGRKGETDNFTGWTTDKFIEFLNKSNGEKCFTLIDDTELIMKIIIQNSDKYIDIKSGSCNFDNEDFQTLIKSVNDFYNNKMNDTDSTYDPAYSSVLQNGYTVDVNNISNLSDLENMYSDDNVNIIGFPSFYGSSSVIVPEYSVSISRKSVHKEQSWEFIKSLLCDENQSHTDFFPVKKSAYQSYISDDNKKSCVEYFEKIYSNSEFQNNINSKLNGIISEEMNKYFNGEYANESEATSALQNKINMFLKERE